MPTISVCALLISCPIGDKVTIPSQQDLNMRAHVPKWGLILFSVVTMSLCREVSDDEIDLIIDKFKEVGKGAPPIDVITQGTTSDRKGKLVFNFKFLTEDGRKCSGKVLIHSNGAAGCSWECKGNTWRDEDDEETQILQKRRRKKKGKPYKRRGNVIIKPKRKKGNNKWKKKRGKGKL